MGDSSTVTEGRGKRVRRPNPRYSDTDARPQQRRNIQQRAASAHPESNVAEPPSLLQNPETPNHPTLRRSRRGRSGSVRPRSGTENNRDTPPGSPNHAESPEVDPETRTPNQPTRRSRRGRSGSIRPRSGTANSRDTPPASADNPGGEEAQVAAVLPQWLTFAEDEFKPQRFVFDQTGDVFFVSIAYVMDEEDAQNYFDVIKSKAHQVPSDLRHIGSVDVTPENISPLPIFSAGSPVFRKIMLIYLPELEIITGFIICGKAPHPHANHIPPQDHHCPHTLTGATRRKTYTGFGDNGHGSPTMSLASRVKEELVACAINFRLEEHLEEDITVRVFSSQSQFIRKLKCEKEDLLAGTRPRRIFENNHSIWIIRERLIHAVGGNLNHYCENDGAGGARFIPYNDILDDRTDSTLSFNDVSQYLGNSTLLRNNANFAAYHAWDEEVTLAENNFLSDRTMYLSGASHCTYAGEVDRWRHVSTLASRALLDAGVHGGHCHFTITVRNAQTQRNVWEGIVLDQEYAHDLLADNPDTAPPPVINSSHERWTEFAEREIGLFHHLGEPFQDTPEHQAFGLKCSALWIVKMMNERFNNTAAPCCFASIEPNAAGEDNSHVQVLFTFQAPNRRIPDGFIAYLNNCIWTVGAQSKSSGAQGRFQDVRSDNGLGSLVCRPHFDYVEFCRTLLYMMKDERTHSSHLSLAEQRAHHSRIKVGIQPGGLMISYLPQTKEGYRTFFGQTRVLVGRISGKNVNQKWQQHHFPPDFLAGNFNEPQQELAHRINQLPPIDHDRGMSRISVNQWRRRSSRNGARVGYTA